MGPTSETDSKEGGSDVRGSGAGVLVIASPGEEARNVQATLTRRGYVVSLAESGEQGCRALSTERATRLVMLVLPLADRPAGEILKALREIDTHVPCIILGRDREVSSAEDAVAIGAADYIDDIAVPHPHDFLARVGFVVGARRGDRHLQYLHAKELPGAGWQSIIGQSPVLLQVVSVLQQVCARSQRGTPTIFLGGETGTGKGFVAKCVHSNGVRKNRPFVEVNCAALPASLIEAELFGHERGSFTDAKTARCGLFETADGGTLFLDEIGAIPLDLQAKLLTAIEEKKVRRIGARTSTSVDVQIVAATHADLRKMVRDGSFREDLFHRLNVVSVTIPPLRERGADVLLLAESFLRMFCREYGMPQRRLGADATEWVLEYSWPGNVRELKNQIERVVLLGDDEIIHASQFQSSGEAPKSVQVRAARGEVQVTLPPTGVSLEIVEREILRQALSQCDGNVSRAARFLSISRQTFIYRMKKHGLTDDPK